MDDEMGVTRSTHESREMHTKFYPDNLKKESITLRWNLKRLYEILLCCRLSLSDSGHRPVAGCCEHGNEQLGSVTGGGISWPVQRLLVSKTNLLQCVRIHPRSLVTRVQDAVPLSCV